MNQDQPFMKTTSPGAAVTAEQWAADFQAATGREPTMSEFQAAQADGRITKDRDPAMEQMTAGLKQFAGGAKGLYKSRVAPAVERSGAKEFLTEKVAPAARSAADRVQAEAGPSGSLEIWTKRAPRLLPVVAFVAIIALFLPIASMAGYSINFFSEDARGEGIALLLFFLATIATALWSLSVKTKVAAAISGVVTSVAGIFGVLDGFGNMIAYSSDSGAAVGLGLVLLGLTGAALLVGGLLSLLGLKSATKAPSIH